VPTALGIFFTPWILDKSLLVGAGVTALAVAAMFLAFRRGFISRLFLAAMGSLYLVFVAIILAFHLT